MFSGLPTCGCRKRALYFVQQHHLEKQEGWSQDPAGLDSAGPGWGPSTGLPASFADSSVSQHNRIHLLSEDISFYGIYIPSKTSFSCQSCPVKLILCKCSSPDQELQPAIPVSLILALVSRISPFLLEILSQNWVSSVNPAEANLWSRTFAAQNLQVVSSSCSSLHKHSKKKV